jgi:TRAP-type C4-dicarboxylate transport system substrate-binding protein
MLPALDTAAAFYGQHMPDGLPREQRNAIRDALAALIAAERAAVREACKKAIAETKVWMNAFAERPVAECELACRECFTQAIAALPLE